jgi:hypothetical protein
MCHVDAGLGLEQFAGKMQKKMARSAPPPPFG